MGEPESVTSVRCLVVGDAHVGKTSLIRAFVHRGMLNTHGGYSSECSEFSDISSDDTPVAYQKSVQVGDLRRKLLVREALMYLRAVNAFRSSTLTPMSWTGASATGRPMSC